ncbi:two-component histidine kinase [Holotrichia oblita]|nr:two-component histidine kinase [Holotrichia oblita]
MKYIILKKARFINPKKHKKAGFMRKGIAVACLAALCVSAGYMWGNFPGSSAADNTSAASESLASSSTEGNKQVYTSTNVSSNDSDGTTYTIAQVAEMTAGSVVEITTETVTKGSYLGQYVSQGAGSGVIISADGYIITNNHVIDGASNITVKLKDDDKDYKATLVGTDSKTDIAVIKIEAEGLQPAIFGDSSTLIVGQDVVAIGNPLGSLGGTVTNGIVSALGREIEVEGETMTLLQTNAAINPGNSGGGLFNLKGELVGVVNAKSSGSDIEGLGFAIPSNTAKSVAEDLMNYGYVKGRIGLGMNLIDITDNQTAMMYRVNRLGVYVLKVDNSGSAKDAGLESGDCILSIDGKEVESYSDFTKIIDGHKIVFVAFVIALLWVMQVVFLDDFYKYIKTDEVKSTASTIKNKMKSETESELKESISELSRKGSMSVLLIKPDKTILINAENGMSGPIFTYANNNFDEILASIEDNGGEYLQIISSENIGFYTGEGRQNTESRETRPANQDKRVMNTIFYASAGQLSDGTTAVIILNSNITPVDATVQTIRSQLIIITVILLVGVLLVAMLSSMLISSPIMRINNASKELAKGNYNIKFKGNGYKEIAELSLSLNYASQELSKVDDYRRELMANVSHDLRTPLTLISGYAEVMRDIPGENTSENIQTIIDESNRLNNFVNDVLDLSKFESNVQTLNSEEYNLTQSMQEIVNRIGRMTMVKGYDICFKCDEEVWVNADEMKISQVVYNLLGNAITHTGNDKKVVIRQDIKGNIARISVIDTGEGIPKENLKAIWERYYKVDKEHKRAQVGTGLGLSIVKSIFNLHRIRYGVTSEVGKGSIFWFELPVVR